jgi:hypothetical protein
MNKCNIGHFETCDAIEKQKELLSKFETELIEHSKKFLTYDSEIDNIKTSIQGIYFTHLANITKEITELKDKIEKVQKATDNNTVAIKYITDSINISSQEVKDMHCLVMKFITDHNNDPEKMFLQFKDEIEKQINTKVDVIISLLIKRSISGIAALIIGGGILMPFLIKVSQILVKWIGF